MAPPAGASGASGLPYGSVDRHRSNPEERGRQWFGGEAQYPDPSAYPRHETPADSAYRSQDTRGGVRAPAGVPPQRGGQGPWTSEHALPGQHEMAVRDPTHHRDVTSTGEVSRVTGRAAGSFVHPESSRRRPVAGVLIWLVTAALALPVLRVLIDSAVRSPLSASGVVSSVLLLLGLPIGAIGLHGLASGATRSTRLADYAAWLRPPVTYVPIALLLFIAAGLAAR